MWANQLNQLDHNIEAMLNKLKQLQYENQRLQAREQQLLQEKTLLADKNQTAKHKIESMINKLKEFEALTTQIS